MVIMRGYEFNLSCVTFVNATFITKNVTNESSLFSTFLNTANHPASGQSDGGPKNSKSRRNVVTFHFSHVFPLRLLYCFTVLANGASLPVAPTVADLSRAGYRPGAHLLTPTEK